jgi:peptide/nickel transport system substrate-binding protein
MAEQWRLVRIVFALIALSALNVAVAAPGFAQRSPTMLRNTQVWPVKIDPAVGSDYASATALANLYDPLVYPKADGSVEPHLAAKWDTSADGKTYTFTLRRGVRFHNRTELTAEDVKFSFDRLQKLGTGFAFVFKDKVASVEATSRYQVVFKLTKPFGPFLGALARLFIVSKNEVLQHKVDGPFGEFGDYGQAWLSTHDAGSGAYTVKEFDVSNSLTLEKVRGYFAFMDPEAPEIFRMIDQREAATNRAWMRQGELEITHHWMPDEAYEGMAELPGVRVASWPAGSQVYVMLNTKKPPLDDVNVRRALAWAFDYDAATKQIYKGTQPGKGPVSRLLPGWSQSVFQYTYNLDRARQELARSKYAGKFDQNPIISVWSRGNTQRVQMGLMLQAEAKKIGLNVVVEQVPYPEIIQRVTKVETTPHILGLSIGPNYAEAGAILESKYDSASTGTIFQTEWLQDAQLDKMIADALATTDRQKRFAQYAEIQQKIAELCPTIFAVDEVEKHAYQASYVTWPQATRPIPLYGYNIVARFIKVRSPQ